MLVLTRKVNQSIVIGDNVEVVILECKDGTVKIGIEAPKNVKVFRKEIVDEIIDENSKALSPDMNVIQGLLANRSKK